MENEGRRHWLTFALTALGGMLIAALTIPPDAAVANFVGWVTMISGWVVPQDLESVVTWLSLLVAVASLVAAAFTFTEGVVIRQTVARARKDLGLPPSPPTA